MPYKLPELPYAYDALEPHIDAQTMEIHHTKHHQTYVDKLNAALEKHDNIAARPAEDIIRDLEGVPDSIRVAVRNHGGGHVNHSMFWTMMSPDGGGEPKGEIATAIEASFKDFASFKELFTAEALGRFGSGWAWLVRDGEGSLSVMSTPNQDSPLSEGFTPLLGLDVWEHAYYLKYQNKRPDYLEAFWNIVSWEQVAKNYEAAK